MYIYMYIYMYICIYMNILLCLSDCNWTQTHNHGVCKRTLNHLPKLVKWLSVCLRTKWLWVRVQL